MARYRWRRYRRITTAGVPGTQGTQLCTDDPRRVALRVVNVGAGRAYASEENNAASANECDVILENNGTFLPGTAPIAPQNEIWCWGDAGHDLRVSEIIEGGDGFV